MLQVTPSTEFVLRLLAHCGAATVRQLHQSPDPVTPRWLSAFARESEFVTLPTRWCRTCDIRYATLTPAGKRFVREMLGITPYRTTPAQLVHDLTLAGYYLRLVPAARATWRNPEQLLAGVRARYRKRVAASYPDGLYEVDGRVVAVEIAGAKLTRTQIEQKQNTAWAQWDVQDLDVVKAGSYADEDF